MNVGQVLAAVRERLQAGSESASLDAQVLLGHLLDRSRAWLLAHPEAVLSAAQTRQVFELTSRLEAGEPLPYIIGYWEFYGLDFKVTPDVLIPRPETELLVDEALAWLRANPRRRRAADIGTGSGCIAVTLAVKIPDLELLASDLSPAALLVAIANAKHHGVGGRIQFVHADLLHGHADESHPYPFDLLCANLPYIPTQTLLSLDVYQREPTLALDGGGDGLDIFRRLLAQASACLAPQALLLLEIEASQGQSAAALAREHLPQAEVRVLPDLAGHPRLLRITT